MYPDQALKDLMDYLLADSSRAVTYHLYKNLVVIDEDTVLGDFTEAAFPGYAAKAAETEPAATTDAFHQAVSEGADMTWTCTSTPGSTEQIYGIYITFVDASLTAKLLCAAAFPSPVAIAASGNTVVKKVNYYFKNYTP